MKSQLLTSEDRPKALELGLQRDKGERIAPMVPVLENPHYRQTGDWDSRTEGLGSDQYTGYNTCINPRRGWGPLKYNEGAGSEAQANNKVCEFINI